ncbi:PTS sugar transporter subunit IIA [Amnibacterium kyonggiense]|uniref:Mannitol-specific phosphotransferase enzyme IIA component n=1 Tax=Amnibacterium kyonggiense TaxID=595671 RepID=A0A4R7FLY0_9MICO|nr:PTS sugar transporter subunit IIA [Amnibacterium kyonggiense]TDS77403.1 PTS system IIA component (Fru family) [Amnibacterium kyonggiense]
MADSALTSLLAERSILLDRTATDRFDAVRQCGAALVAAGAVDESYVDAMIQREETVSTFVGEGVAIPHGTLAGKEAVKHDALVVLRFPDGVDWEGNTVSVCVGIAAAGGGHIALLSQLAEILLDPEKAEQLRTATSAEQVYALLAPDEDED